LLRNKTLSDREKYDLALQIAEGMDYLHSQGVVHRDLKGQNVMRFSDGRVVICDFGLARFVQAGETSFGRAKTSNVAGTEFYMAPEVFDGC